VLNGVHNEEAFIEVSQKNEQKLFAQLIARRDQKSALIYNKSALRHKRNQMAK